MDSFELNKIIAAVLLTALIVIGIGKFTDILFHVEKPKESAYKIEGLDEAQKKMGSLVCDVSLPQIGQPKSSTYEGEGWVIIQGQNTEKVKMAALELIRTVRIYYR